MEPKLNMHIKMLTSFRYAQDDPAAPHDIYIGDREYKIGENGLTKERAETMLAAGKAEIVKNGLIGGRKPEPAIEKPAEVGVAQEPLEQPEQKQGKRSKKNRRNKKDNQDDLF